MSSSITTKNFLYVDKKIEREREKKIARQIILGDRKREREVEYRR
jgi:hypothetical protein